jgi:hypothetical protein
MTDCMQVNTTDEQWSLSPLGYSLANHTHNMMLCLCMRLMLSTHAHTDTHACNRWDNSPTAALRGTLHLHSIMNYSTTGFIYKKENWI